MVDDTGPKTCQGCRTETYTVEYISNGKSIGDYCIECMCCPECGEVVDEFSLAYYEVVHGLSTQELFIPTKYCRDCIRKGV